MPKDFRRRWHKPKPGTRDDKKFISSADLRTLISRQLGEKLDRNFGLYIADGEYYCTPVDDAREVIENSALDRQTWVRQRFDCDDFAHVLKAHFAQASYADGKRRAAHCFGVVWGMLPGPHAINWMVNDDLKLRFIEPQTDEIFFPREDDKDIWFMLV
jgi:hypothetical protein